MPKLSGSVRSVEGSSQRSNNGIPAFSTRLTNILWESRHHCKEAFDYLIAKIQQYGPIRIDAVKSSINIAGKYHFAMVYVLRNSLNLEFIFDRYLDHRRIFRTQKLGPAKYSHVVKLVHIQDVNAQLLRWLRKAYSLRR